MNEEQKNIETCLPENILAEVASVPTDPQFVSLTDEALDPLKQQALQKAGYDGYEKVVWTHKPYTFTSAVKEMKSNLILLLRRLWRFPFGRGNTASSDAGSDAGSSSAASAAAPIRSLADMWQHYITRLQGNPEYGIPSRLSQLTDLPDAPTLLADRDMSSGIRFGTNPLPDGMSLAQLLCSTSANSSVTEIVDTNVGWTMNKEISKFPALKKLVLGCKRAEVSIANNIQSLEELGLPFLERLSDAAVTFIGGVRLQDVVEIPNLRGNEWAMNHRLLLVNITGMRVAKLPQFDFFEGDGANILSNCPELEEIYIGNGHDRNISLRYSTGTDTPSFCFLGKLRKVVFGHYPYIGYRFSAGGSYGLVPTSSNGVFKDSPNLIHIECSIANLSIYLNYWSPTNALDASRTDLIEEGSTAQNNLQQFLQNFRDYIALRLTDKGSGLTLTLSQEVRNAIHAAEDEYGIENIIITQKGWTISPAPN